MSGVCSGRVHYDKTYHSFQALGTHFRKGRNIKEIFMFPTIDEAKKELEIAGQLNVRLLKLFP